LLRVERERPTSVEYALLGRGIFTTRLFGKGRNRGLYQAGEAFYYYVVDAKVVSSRTRILSNASKRQRVPSLLEIEPTETPIYGNIGFWGVVVDHFHPGRRHISLRPGLDNRVSQLVVESHDIITVIGRLCD